MARTPPPFEIHVDPSCLSEDFEKENIMPTERATSNETIVHHDSWSEQEIKNAQQTPEAADEHADEVKNEDAQSKEDEARERRIEKIQAEIRSAAERVVASIEQENFDKEDSVLSTRTDESCDQESDFTHEEETELRYGEGTEVSYESEHGNHSEHNSEGAGDSSSHHDGDIDDDVFSSSNRSSARSSINSISDLQDIDENQKLLTSPAVGEDAASGGEHEIISRVPSASSYIRSGVDDDRTPSKVMTRPPFRTPSSVRAMQMSSPTQSLFSSPRSAKRHMPTVSRLGTPTSHSSPTKRTPTRFKVKKEYPLVLLHVTVLPLQWKYSHAMTSEVPEPLRNVKDSWRLLQNKLGDTVLERGVLLAHPQDSYETLEERLLEALELPVRPRAKILKCGHYMGPTDSDAPSSDDELGESWAIEKREDRNWCDVCRRSVRLEDIGVGDLDKRFVIKIYASNGLMRAGAWAAAWREMERVDVEIEPFVETNLHAELEHLALITPVEEPSEKHQEEDDGFVDEDMMIEHVHDHEQEDQERREAEIRLREEEVRSRMAEEEEMRQRMADDENLRQLRIVEGEEMKQRLEDEERQKASQLVNVEHLQQLRIVEGQEMRHKFEEEERQRISQLVNAEHLRQLRLVEEEEAKRRLEDEERQKISQMAEELGIRHRMDRDNDMRRKIEEDRMRETYGHQTPNPAHHERHDIPRQNSPRNAVRGDESLSELLFAAFKVAIRDSKNVTILLLSAFVLFLALRPTSSVHSPAPIIMGESPSVIQVTTTVFTEVVATPTQPIGPLTVDPPAALEASAVVITETVAAAPVTTIIVQERTVTEMVPAPSMPSEVVPELLEVEEDSALPVVEDAASIIEEQVVLSSSSRDTIEAEGELEATTEEQLTIPASSIDTTETDEELGAETEEPLVLQTSSADTDTTETEVDLGAGIEEHEVVPECSADVSVIEEEPAVPTSSLDASIIEEEEETDLPACSTDDSATEEEAVLPETSLDFTKTEEDVGAETEEEMVLPECSTDISAIEEEPALPAVSLDPTGSEEDLKAETEKEIVLCASSTEEEFADEIEEQIVLSSSSTDAIETDEDLAAEPEEQIVLYASSTEEEAADEIEEQTVLSSSTDTTKIEEQLEAVVEEPALSPKINDEEMTAPLVEEVEAPVVAEKAFPVTENTIKKTNRPCVRKPLSSA